MSSSNTAAPSTSVCALAGCEVAVIQPPEGGRRRLYCSNAHRAEARRRRLTDSPESAPGDLLGPAIARLGSVLDDLRSYEATLRSIDPGIQAAEVARIRAQATAEVLAAQQLGATAAEEAARLSARLVTERNAWEADSAAHQADADELRAALARGPRGGDRGPGRPGGRRRGPSGGDRRAGPSGGPGRGSPRGRDQPAGQNWMRLASPSPPRWPGPTPPTIARPPPSMPLVRPVNRRPARRRLSAGCGSNWPPPRRRWTPHWRVPSGPRS